MNQNHRIIIVWSNEDEAFLAIAPEFRGCIAHGDTRAEALSNVELMIQDWHDYASESGIDTPTAVSNEDMISHAMQMEAAKRDEIKRAVESVLSQAIPKIISDLQNRLPIPASGDDDACEYLEMPNWRS